MQGGVAERMIARCMVVRAKRIARALDNERCSPRHPTPAGNALSLSVWRCVDQGSKGVAQDEHKRQLIRAPIGPEEV